MQDSAKLFSDVINLSLSLLHSGPIYQPDSFYKSRKNMVAALATMFSVSV